MESRGGPAQPTRRRKRGDPLTPAQAAEAVHARVAANGSERLSLKGRTLDGPAAVRAACDAILALHPPTVTLNLTLPVTATITLTCHSKCCRTRGSKMCR